MDRAEARRDASAAHAPSTGPAAAGAPRSDHGRGRRLRSRLTAPWTSGTRPTLVEWLVAAGAAITLVAVAVPVHLDVYRPGPAAVALIAPLSVVQGLTVVVALVLPRTAAALHVAALWGIAACTLPSAAWTGAADGLPWPVTVVGMVALPILLVVLCLRGHVWTAVVAWTAGFAVLLAGTLLAAALGGAPGTATADLIVAASVSAGVLALAAVTWLLLLARRDVETVRHEAEEIDERRRWALERARIAREMHDVVAHSMSLVHMRATSARFRLPGLSEEAVAEFDGIAEQARGALGEMRGLLGVLRDESERLDAPQPGLADLESLLDSTREAGIVVDAALPDPLPSPSAAVQLAFYRVVQESLSNVSRHAGGAATSVRLEVDGDELRAQVRNVAPAVAAQPVRDRGGHGLRGMMERMISVDGVLEHGPTPDGGYLVAARAPYRRTGTA